MRWRLPLCLFVAAAGCSSPDPESQARCGDARLGAGEECDDGNRIDDDAISSLAAATKNGALPSVATLQLDHNEIGDGGAEALFGALEASRSISWVRRYEPLEL